MSQNEKASAPTEAHSNRGNGSILPQLPPAPTFLQCRAAEQFVRAVEAADLGSSLLAKAAELFWPEVERLWIRSTLAEVALALAARALRQAANAAQESVDAIGDQRQENQLSNLAERSIERGERRRARGEA